MCLDEIEVGDRKFLGMSSRCDTRLYWNNQRYLTLTEEQHYGPAENGTVPAESQKWVIMTPSGCLKMLRSEFPDGGDLIEIDSGCSNTEANSDTEFWAITPPDHLEVSLNTLGTDAFSLVDGHQNNSRRFAFWTNLTTEIYDVTKNKTCSCVSAEEDRKMDTLLVSRHHLHLRHENELHNYFMQKDECSGHTFVLVPFSPSPPPPDGDAAPPAPPLFVHEIKVATGSLAVGGLWFCCCFLLCIPLGQRIRGNGRSKWWGTREMRISRQPIANGDASDNRAFGFGGSFLERLPPASRPLLSGP